MEDSGVRIEGKEEKEKLPPPELEQEYHNVTILATGIKGDGIFKTPAGFVIIVAGAKRGDIVSIKVKRVFEKYAFAELMAKE